MPMRCLAATSAFPRIRQKQERGSLLLFFTSKGAGSPAHAVLGIVD
jgi:hypothetical protein